MVAKELDKYSICPLNIIIFYFVSVFVPFQFQPIDTITDTFGRVHTYLRISLTERCNLRCKCQHCYNIDIDIYIYIYRIVVSSIWLENKKPPTITCRSELVYMWCKCERIFQFNTYRIEWDGMHLILRPYGM